MKAKRNKQHKNPDPNRKDHIKLRLMCVCMIGVMAVGVVLNFAIEGLKETESYTVETIRSDNFDYIMDELDQLTDDAYNQAESVATNIETGIKNSDMESIKEDLDRGIFNEELYGIVRSSIEEKNLNGVDNFRNGILIMTPTGIYEDLSVARASDSNVRDWKDEIDRAYNTELHQEGINKIINHSEDLVITEPNNFLSEDVDHRKIKSYSEKELRKVYMEEGIEGLKNYQVWVPVYITDTGDIFGQSDVVKGVRHPTHKIIVVQEFNLYDQLKEISPRLFESTYKDTSITDIKMSYHYTIIFLYIIGIIYVVEVVVALFYFTEKYNAIVERCNSCNNNSTN